MERIFSQTKAGCSSGFCGRAFRGTAAGNVPSTSAQKLNREPDFTGESFDGRPQTQVVLLFGGRSAEHDVSILSARSVRAAADPARLNIVPVCVGRDGRFLDPDVSTAVLDGAAGSGPSSFSFELWVRENRPDAVFPLIHGTTGEDGTLQGYLEMLDLPCVGSGVTGSAVGMDKWFMKAAFATAGLPIVRQVTASTVDWRDDRQSILDRVEARLMLPFFVKPANAGSSVGVSKVKTIESSTPLSPKRFALTRKF